MEPRSARKVRLLLLTRSCQGSWLRRNRCFPGLREKWDDRSCGPNSAVWFGRGAQGTWTELWPRGCGVTIEGVADAPILERGTWTAAGRRVMGGRP